MDKTRVLFVCVHNSARSQMAEAFLNTLAGDRFGAESAGIEPGVLNPLAVEVMEEAGIDISRNRTKNVFDLFERGAQFSYVITVCEAAAEACPFFPGIKMEQLHWAFDDPSAFKGSHEERLARTRDVRDAIKAKIEAWLREI